jgi:hypothetical protein
MSRKEEFYTKVGKFSVEELKNFLEKEELTFDNFAKEYKNFKSEEEFYKKKLDRLNKYERPR